MDPEKTPVWKTFLKKKRLKVRLAVNGTTSHSYGVSLAMGSHSVTFHLTQVSTPRLNPARQDGTRCTYPRGMEGWVDL